MQHKDDFKKCSPSDLVMYPNMTICGIYIFIIANIPDNKIKEKR